MRNINFSLANQIPGGFQIHKQMDLLHYEAISHIRGLLIDYISVNCRYVKIEIEHKIKSHEKIKHFTFTIYSVIM